MENDMEFLKDPQAETGQKAACSLYPMLPVIRIYC